MCKENLSFLLKLLNITTYESGISPLIQDTVLHQSLYKHLKFIMKNQDGR